MPTLLIALVPAAIVPVLIETFGSVKAAPKFKVPALVKVPVGRAFTTFKVKVPLLIVLAADAAKEKPNVKVAPLATAKLSVKAWYPAPLLNVKVPEFTVKREIPESVVGGVKLPIANLSADALPTIPPAILALPLRLIVEPAPTVKIPVIPVPATIALLKLTIDDAPKVMSLVVVPPDSENNEPAPAVIVPVIVPPLLVNKIGPVKFIATVDVCVELLVITLPVAIFKVVDEVVKP